MAYDSIASRKCGCDDIVFDHQMVSVETAIHHASSLVSGVRETDLISIEDCVGRILARDLFAPREMPFFDNSAMDGFAINTADFVGHGPWSFDIAGTIGAGDRPKSGQPVSKPSSWRIFTGAPVPVGFDAVAIQEKCVVQSGKVRIAKRPLIGQNIRCRGSDVERNALLVSAATELNPRHVGLLAANGYNAVNVFGRPRVGILSTGDELIEPGGKLQSGQIYDCNRSMLLALAKQSNAQVSDMGRLPDNLFETTKLFQSCAGQFDLIISSGAVSVGERDYLKPAFERAGGTIGLWKVAVKPGKPVMFGKLGGTALTALPGNPMAVFLGFQLFVEPQLRTLLGLAVEKPKFRRGVADFSWERTGHREEYFPIRLATDTCNENGVLEKLGNGGSGSLYPLSMADGLGVVSTNISKIKKGDLVSWLPFIS